MTKYYKLIHPNKGHHYFRVKSTDDDVLKVTFGVQPKKGRPWCPGITLIRYTTFIASYGWNLSGKFPRGYQAEEITEEEFEAAYKTLILLIK